MKSKFKLFFNCIVLIMVFSVLVGCSKTKDTKLPTNTDGKQISTKDLKVNLTKTDWVVVDTRINDAFNGWKFDGVTRGGHITGATDFSAGWLKVEVEEKDKKLAEILKVKGITLEKKIVLYDANGKDRQEVADYFLRKSVLSGINPVLAPFILIPKDNKDAREPLSDPFNIAL